MKQGILTLVNYATGYRYPEIVPLKKITTEALAEALLHTFSSVAIPDDVLNDQGTQFMSECMEEVSRLLSIKGLNSTPYHLNSNGLVERWNRTLKSMLEWLCQDQLKQWHRLTECSPTEKFPRSWKDLVHFSCYMDDQSGPGMILKELLWTKAEVNVPGVKCSYEYVTELHERLENSLKLAQE